MTKFYRLLALEIILIICLAIFMTIQEWPEGYAFLVAYLVLLVLYIYRHKKGLPIQDVNKFFRLYTWAWIVILILIIVFSIFSGGYFSGYYYVLSLSYIVSAIAEIIVDSYPTLIILLLLIGILKVNNHFISLVERKKKYINKKITLVVSVIVLAGMISWTTWNHAYIVEGQIMDIYSDDLQIANTQVNRYFDNAFRGIIIFDSFIFISTFLLLYSWKKEDKANN
jgi:hypothetical protein